MLPSVLTRNIKFHIKKTASLNYFNNWKSYSIKRLKKPFYSFCVNYEGKAKQWIKKLYLSNNEPLKKISFAFRVWNGPNFQDFFAHYQSDLILKAVLLQYYFNQTFFLLQTTSEGKNRGKYFDGQIRYPLWLL